MKNKHSFYRKQHVVLMKTSRRIMEKSLSLARNPNRTLDRYSTIRNWKDNFLSSFIFLLASFFSFVLAARYAFELTVNNLLNNQIKPVQDLMTDLG